MKNIIVFSIFFLFVFFSGCKKNTEQNENADVNKNSNIENKTLRNKVFNEFLFLYGGVIEDKITGEISEVFREYSPAVKLDTAGTKNPNLKTQEEILYEYKFGVPSEEGITQYSSTFSRNGKIEKKYYPFNKGKRFSEFELIFEYNGKENISGIICRNYNAENLYTTFFKYDSISGRFNSEVCRFKNTGDKGGKVINYMPGDVAFKQYNKLYRYNDLGLVKEIITWGITGELEEKLFFNYDNEGSITDYALYGFDNSAKKVIRKTQIGLFNKEIEVKEYDKNKKAVSRTVYVYDSLYRLIEIRHLTSSNIAAKNIFYKYEGDKLVETMLVNTDTTQNRKIINKYNDKNNITERILYDYTNTPVLILKKAYDNRQNLTEELLVSGDQEMVNKYSYSYDNRNLLTEKIQYDYLIEPRKLWKYTYSFH